jgi:3-oxoacyl-[acyl-carrier-protein] synthase-3
MTITRSVISSCGHYLPEKIITNDDLAKLVDTSDEWIVNRTGIKQRHFVEEGEYTSHLAIKAANDALTRAGLGGDDIDLVIVATTTPDLTFPAVAVQVQAAIGMNHGFAFDIQAVCSGFVYALSVADNFIKSGQVKRALIIGAETFSRLLNSQDRTSFVLFGDGAGAVVLEAALGEGTIADRGIFSSHLHSDGRFEPLLRSSGGVSTTKEAGLIEMQGKEVFRHAVVNLASVVTEALQANNITADDLDWVVPHQANKRILDGTVKKLGLDPDKLIVTVQDHGNTSAASVPLALAIAVKDGRITKGDLILFEAMGAGFTWGSVLLRY